MHPEKHQRWLEGNLLAAATHLVPQVARKAFQPYISDNTYSMVVPYKMAQILVEHWGQVSTDPPRPDANVPPSLECQGLWGGCARMCLFARA